ncbi:divergent polysaccharide deacetylase family protein [Photobacterium rosenbergii]|uniref:Divergent polysaccharide deacetylase family protein n=1 Tax=Photobacterium rosenbergii TaxID=294936 RepID=A0A2T3NCR1_9GAMM|nr:divergent polysaccharide deacetylase family protein [Photobacterium rosenbergii]PSW11838.1 divergent polysaccharide deacetylase family protein [Photobacterium rosenbergii]
MAKRRRLKEWAYGLALIISLGAPSLAQAAKLAIVIDDLGYQRMPAALSALPPQVSISILPDTPYDRATSKLAHKQQRDVLLHMPMEPLHRAPLEMATLTREMDQQTLQHVLRWGLERVPDAIAVNNHMGSALTQSPQAMDWVMEVLSEQGLFFLDSRTSAKSVALERAQQQNVPALRRHIFLDHLSTEKFVNQQLSRAIQQAKKRGYAIAIGHPYPVTLEMLSQVIPTLEQQGVQLVRISELAPPS